MNSYNPDRFIELLKKQADLTKQNEKLISSENTELLRYNVVLYDYVCWKNRDEILKLLKQFLDDQMDGPTFDREFLELWRFNRDLSKFIRTKVELINLIEIDPKSTGCSLIVSNLMGFLELYNYPEDEHDDYEAQKKRRNIRRNVTRLNRKRISKVTKILKLNY